MECPVCLEVYRTPLLLPGCGHTICQPCAQIMVTADNYLTCPECRLLYQLRRGVASLPKNIALQRTIDEAQKSEAEPRCQEHPADTATLYCRTCDKNICLKCYFSGTLRKGQSLKDGAQGAHQGHNVKTSQDAIVKETRLLEEASKSLKEKVTHANKYVFNLHETEYKLKKTLELKLAEIEKRKEALISNIKQTSNKLKYTLKGTVARDTEATKEALKEASDHLAIMESLYEESQTILLNAQAQQVPIQTLIECQERLCQVPTMADKPQLNLNSLLAAEKFNTDIETCLKDPNKALSYQCEVPRQPSIAESEHIISDTAAYLTIEYSQAVRTEKLTLFYKQAMFKGMSEKPWVEMETTELHRGKSTVILRHLDTGTMYRIKARAENVHGVSKESKEVMFRTADEKCELRTT